MHALVAVRVRVLGYVLTDRASRVNDQRVAEVPVDSFTVPRPDTLSYQSLSGIVLVVQSNQELHHLMAGRDSVTEPKDICLESHTCHPAVEG